MTAEKLREFDEWYATWRKQIRPNQLDMARRWNISAKRVSQMVCERRERDNDARAMRLHKDRKARAHSHEAVR